VARPRPAAAASAGACGRGDDRDVVDLSPCVCAGQPVVSVLDSGAVATLSGNSLRQTVHTHCASVHQAAKLVAALLRVARVTAGLA